MIARVVDQTAERGVRELILADEVALPQLDRIDADLGGERVHRSLDGVGGLGATGTSIGVGRCHRS